MDDRIERRADFDFIRYANCWEDADVLCQALEPRPGSRMLSIASGGDNSFALLAEGAEVVAADLSTAQLACVELKQSAFRHLDHDGLLRFLGVRHGSDRPATYDGLKKDLTSQARAFWDGHRGQIAAGIIHAGKFEGYFRLFRTRIVPLIHGRRTVARLLEEKDESARRRFYDTTWNNLRWRLLFRVFFSRFMMGRLGRDPEFFRYVEGSVAARVLSRAERALTALPTHANPYLEYILTGNFERSLPRYLRPENFEAIRGSLDRLVLFQGPIQDAARKCAEAGFDGFNLSDIFEYLSPAACREIYEQLLGAARPGARLAYWNMLVPRRCPDDLAERVEAQDDLARRLFAQDLAFFYGAFVIEEVRP